MRNHLTPACSGATVLARFVPIFLLLVLSACGGSSSHTFVTTQPGPPTIASLSPTAGVPGLTVKITGTNFGPTPGTVTFNETTASVVNWTDSLIVAKVPSGASTGNVVVTAGGSASNGVSFNIVTVQAGTITISNFGFQCGTGATNCPDQSSSKIPTWPASVAQPGLLRLWDSQVSWSYLMTGYSGGVGTYDWAQLDGYLDDIAAHQPLSVNYVFGCVPSFATSGPSGTTPGSCGTDGSATPPDDLGTGSGSSSPTFNQFVTDLLNHCSHAGNCVKTLITGYELWNEANVSSGPGVRWTGTQLQLYQMVKPAVTTIKANNPSAKIFTPSITGGGALWMAGWVSTEVSKGIISDVYNIHQYLNNNLPENVLTATSLELAPNTGTPGWTPLPWVMGETGYDDIHLPYNCNAGNTGTPYSTDDCIGQMVRWNLLLFSNGASGLYWYYWNTYIGSQSTSQAPYAEAYSYMMQYLVGGKFTISSPCALISGTTWTCPFTEANGTAALWVWSTDESGATFTVPTGYVDYLDLTGAKTAANPGGSISISTLPIMLEQ
jgi:hypothetical protein